MASYNHAVFIGNLVADPKLRDANEEDVCGFRIAVNDRYKRDAEPMFVSVNLWGRQAEAASNALEKGQRVLVSGRVSVETYEGRDNQTRVSLKLDADDCVFLSAKRKSDDDRPRRRAARPQPPEGRRPFLRHSAMTVNLCHLNGRDEPCSCGLSDLLRELK